MQTDFYHIFFEYINFYRQAYCFKLKKMKIKLLNLVQIMKHFKPSSRFFIFIWALLVIQIYFKHHVPFYILFSCLSQILNFGASSLQNLESKTLVCTQYYRRDESTCFVILIYGSVCRGIVFLSLMSDTRRSTVRQNNVTKIYVYHLAQRAEYPK